MDSFLLLALLAGLGLALVAGPLGCFLVWRRMSYFGATLAHAALLGIALGLLFDILPLVGILVVCIAVSLALVGLQGQGHLSDDTLLGILAHGTLALGLVAISFMESLRIDLMGYLFGDILAVTGTDLLWIYGGGAIALGLLVLLWRPLLFLTLHEELAQVDGIAPAPLRLALMLLISLVIAVAMKIVGVLLIVSMLIIPAAAARRFSATPEQMAMLASGIGCLAVVGGLAASMTWDTPAGPSIVSAATLLFFAFLLVPRGRRQAP